MAKEVKVPQHTRQGGTVRVRDYVRKIQDAGSIRPVPGAKADKHDGTGQELVQIAPDQARGIVKVEKPTNANPRRQVISGGAKGVTIVSRDS